MIHSRRPIWMARADACHRQQPVCRWQVSVDRTWNRTVWSLSSGEQSGACADGVGVFGNGYIEAENPVEDRKNGGYGGGIWCGHDASEIRGETQLLLPTLPDTHYSVASVPTNSSLLLSQSHAILCYLAMLSRVVYNYNLPTFIFCTILLSSFRGPHSIYDLQTPWHNQS